MKTIIIMKENIETSGMPLYFKSGRQVQDAYVMITSWKERIVISAGYNHGEKDNHGRGEKISCPPEVIGGALLKYLESEGFQKEVLLENWEGIKWELCLLEKGEIFSGEEWIENSLTFFSKNGEECQKSSYEVATAEYESIPITEKNLGKLVKKAETFLSEGMFVTHLERTFQDVIDRINL